MWAKCVLSLWVNLQTQEYCDWCDFSKLCSFQKHSLHYFLRHVPLIPELLGFFPPSAAYFLLFGPTTDHKHKQHVRFIPVVTVWEKPFRPLIQRWLVLEFVLRMLELQKRHSCRMWSFGFVKWLTSDVESNPSTELSSSQLRTLPKGLTLAFWKVELTTIRYQGHNIPHWTTTAWSRI